MAITITFFKYFISYIFHNKTRQRLLVLAMVGLGLSSFSLLILQSVMSGLQHNLINRSQFVNGRAEIDLLDFPSYAYVSKVLKKLSDQGLVAYPEYEIELLVRIGDQLSAAIVHGLDFENFKPQFLVDYPSGETILGMELAFKLKAQRGNEISFISPGNTQTILGEVPRIVSATVDQRIITGVPEVDMFHIWTRASLINNLIRKKTFNKIRIFSLFNKEKLAQSLYVDFGHSLKLKGWEDKNSALVWALNLETSIMVFLFIVMSLLVSLSITSGLLIFSDKIKIDLASFWILGGAPDVLKKKALLFLLSLGPITTIIGIILALILLIWLKHMPLDIMPDVFVERTIPVYITLKGLLVSFFTPVCISTIFSLLSFKNFTHQTHEYLRLIRSVGQ